MLKFDFSEVFHALDELAEARESIARRMIVSGGRIMRDRAKAEAPEGDQVTGGYARPKKTGSQEPGHLKDSIYLAYSEKRSDDWVFTYSVSWNSKHGSAKNAFWGVMQEFGFNRGVTNKGGKTYHVVPYKGGFSSVMGQRWQKPRFPGTAFLGRAFEMSLPEVEKAMMEEGRRAFAEFGAIGRT